MRSLLFLFAGLGILGLTAGCGGGYNANYDCNQTAACCEELGATVPSSTVAACKTASQSLYDSYNEALKEYADNSFEPCASKSGCDFIECINGSRQCPWDL